MKKSIIQRAAYGCAILGLASAFTSNVHAALLANEAFDEDANGTTLTSTGHWTAFSGAGNQPLTASGGAVTVSDVTMTVGTSAASGEDDRLTFASTPLTSVVYYSTLVTVPAGTTVTSTAGDYFFSGYNTPATGGGYLGRVFLATSADGGVAFGLTNQGATVASLPAQQSGDLALGSEYRLVLRIDPTAHTATLGVQLASAAPFTADSQLTITSGTAGTIAGLDSVAIRQGSIGNGSLIDDGLQVGTTLADVSGIATGSSAFFNAVPEPSTYATMVAGAGLLGLALRARRKA